MLKDYTDELHHMSVTKREWHEQIERELQHLYSAGLEVADCPVEYADLEQWYKASVPPECVATELYERLKAERNGEDRTTPEDLCEDSE